MQPIHAVSDRDMADKHWGTRSENAYAWKSILSGGVRLIFGSDAPVESPNPFWGLFAAVSRSSLGVQTPRESWLSRERLTLEEALTAYIREPQLVAGMNGFRGVLSVGAPADLVVLSRDIFSLPDNELPFINPASVMFNGHWAYKNE